jgi:glycosyltransferase involved in cell wall biosynthesis
MVSIIIPHFNRADLLKETIESVINQSYHKWELIIVDDGSTVQEFATIMQYLLWDSRITIQQRQSANKGPSACRNEGGASAKYNYLLFLDSDDLLKPFCLEQRMAFMQQNSQAGMAVFLIENFKVTPGDTMTYFNKDLPFNKLIGAFLQNRNPWQTMAPIWKKEFFNQLGGFDETLLFMEDPDLHLRALIANRAIIKIVYDQPADCYYRINLFDITKQNFYFNSIKYRIMFYKSFIEKNKLIIESYATDIRKGIYTMIRIFLYYRKNEFPDLYNELVDLINVDSLFSKYERRKLQFLILTGNSNSWFAKKVKFKGLFFRLLPNK